MTAVRRSGGSENWNWSHSRQQNDRRTEYSLTRWEHLTAFAPLTAMQTKTIPAPLLLDSPLHSRLTSNNRTHSFEYLKNQEPGYQGQDPRSERWAVVAAIACAGVDAAAILQCVAFSFDVLAVVAIVSRGTEPPGTDLAFLSHGMHKCVRLRYLPFVSGVRVCGGLTLKDSCRLDAVLTLEHIAWFRL